MFFQFSGVSKPLKIVFLDAGTLFGISNLLSINSLGEYIQYHHTLENEVGDRLKDADVAITNKVVIDKLVMQNCPNLKLICVAATGMNNIDLEYAAIKKIEVKNVPGYSTKSVAQVTWGMILHLFNHVNYYDHYVKSGAYITNEFFTHVGVCFNELSGKTLGVIGLSTIGKQVAKIAEAFGMKVVYTSISNSVHDSVYERLSLDNLLAKSDVVVIHTPLSPQTKHLINFEKLKLMKSKAFIVNTSRGGIVVESDLVRALNENIIAGAGVDVFEGEPIAENSPYFMVENKSKMVLSPHIAWASVESRTVLVEKIKENILQFNSKADSYF